jgi:iron complex transport system substrate-binding protein
MRFLEDQAGRSIKVPKRPERVVSLAPSITEIIYALGCQDRLKGATRFSDYPEEARDIPRVGSYVSLDLEKIISLNPDVCVAIKDGNPGSVIRRLEALDVPVFAVNPRGIDSVMGAVEHIGELLDESRRAEAVTTEMKRRIQAVETRVEVAENRPRVFFQIGISPIVSAGNDTFIDELIVKAGGRNVAGDRRSYPRFSREEILELAPEVVVITSMARSKAFEQVKEEWERWQEVPAAAEGRVYLVDSDLYDRPSPRLARALEELARLIHPELFPGPNRVD